MPVSLSAAAPDRVPALAGVLGRAFAGDPMARWPLAPTEDPAGQVAAYFAAFDVPFAELGMLWEAGEAEGAALWIPADRTEVMVEVDALTRPLVHGLTDDGGLRHDRFWDWIEDRIPDEPLWLLDHIGVEPARQGRGVGSALLRLGLERARADGVGAFLETAVERNARYYERFGFRTVLEDDAPDDGPHVWFMRCDP